MESLAEYCAKDHVVNLRAIQKVVPEHEEILKEKYYINYPKEEQPYGPGTGRSYEAWKEQYNKYEVELCGEMMLQEIKRLSIMVDSYWLKKAESKLAEPIPPAIKQLIMKYAASPRCI